MYLFKEDVMVKGSYFYVKMARIEKKVPKVPVNLENPPKPKDF